MVRDEMAISVINDELAAMEARLVNAWQRFELGLSEADLATRAGVPNDKAFRQALWSAREIFRARTGRQIVIQSGILVVLSAEEQAQWAAKQERKARRKKKRALEVASLVPVEHLPEAERARHVRRIEHMSRAVAMEELMARKRDVLAGLGGNVLAEIRQRQADSLSRAEAMRKRFG